MKEDQSLTTRILAEQFGVSHMCIVKRLKKLGKAGKFFDDLDHMLDDLNAWVSSKNSEWFALGINLLLQKWQAVLDVDGEYAPE
uniref:Uncharacterized protein n=1 Tax=Acrobeloides nanus TaxID=290746 RepID=A0A914EJB6_9BILA